MSGNVARAIVGEPLSQQKLAEALLGEIRAGMATQTAEVAKLRSQIINDVLHSGLSLLDTSGLFSKEFRSAFGSVFVDNHSTSDVTFHASGPGSAPPAQGVGVYRVPAGQSRLINAVSHVFTIYGAAGAAVSVQAFTKPWAPAAGLGGSSALLLNFLTSSISAIASRPGTALDVTGTAAAGAAVTATLPAAAGVTTWLTGFELTWDASGAVAATSDVLTAAGLANALAWKFGSQVAVPGSLVVELAQPIPASAPNTAIVLSSGAVANRAGLQLNLHGYRV